LLSALKVTPTSIGASGPTSKIAGVAVLGQMVQGQAEASKAPNNRKRKVNRNLHFIAIFSRTIFVYRDRCVSKPPQNLRTCFLFISAKVALAKSRTDTTRRATSVEPFQDQLPESIKWFSLAIRPYRTRQNRLNASARSYERVTNRSVPSGV
jgi:hypothetical protein